MEYHLNVDFNLYGAVDSAWHRLLDGKNQAISRHDDIKHQIRSLNEQLLRNDLNSALPAEVQKSLNIVVVPTIDIYETEAVFNFENHTISIRRNLSESLGLCWQVNSQNYLTRNCSSDNLQSELFLFLADLKNNN